MIKTERSAKRGVKKETVRLSIALSYVKAWQALPPGPAQLLATVLPVLAARDPKEIPAVRLNAAALDNHPDAHREAWKGLKNAARAVHRTKVRHVWHRRNPESEREVRCFANLVWTTEVRIDPVAREVELVFSNALIEYLPAILGPYGNVDTQPSPARVTPAPNGSLTGYCHGRIG